MAIIRFRSVHPRPPSPIQAFFYMPAYDVELHVNYRDQNGALGTRKISERVAITQRQPLGETDLLVPVPEGTVSMEFIGSEGILNH